MFGRHTLLLLLLFLAAAVPYLSSSSTDVWGKISGLWKSGPKQQQVATGGNVVLPSGATVGQQPVTGATPQSPDPQFVDLAEVLNFDVTPAWVMARWPRVSAGLA